MGQAAFCGIRCRRYDAAEKKVIKGGSYLDLHAVHALLPAWPAVLCLCQYLEYGVLQGSPNIKLLSIQACSVA